MRLFWLVPALLLLVSAPAAALDLSPTLPRLDGAAGDAPVVDVTSLRVKGVAASYGIHLATLALFTIGGGFLGEKLTGSFDARLFFGVLGFMTGAALGPTFTGLALGAWAESEGLPRVRFLVWKASLYALSGAMLGGLIYGIHALSQRGDPGAIGFNGGFLFGSALLGWAVAMPAAMGILAFEEPLRPVAGVLPPETKPVAERPRDPGLATVSLPLLSGTL